MLSGPLLGQHFGASILTLNLMLPVHLVACTPLAGDSERKICKAASLEVDVVCLDLEDAVAASRKAEARDTTAKVERTPAEGYLLSGMPTGLPGSALSVPARAKC